MGVGVLCVCSCVSRHLCVHVCVCALCVYVCVWGGMVVCVHVCGRALRVYVCVCAVCVHVCVCALCVCVCVCVLCVCSCVCVWTCSVRVCVGGMAVCVCACVHCVPVSCLRLRLFWKHQLSFSPCAETVWCAEQSTRRGWVAPGVKPFPRSSDL